MNFLAYVLSFGIWPALPISGYFIISSIVSKSAITPFPRITFFSLISTTGIALWSIPLLVTAIGGYYRAEYFGAVGWLISIFSLLLLVKKGRISSLLTFRLSQWEWLLVIGLVLAAFFYFSFPAESIIMNRDEGLYTNHGIYIAHHGRTDVPYPWPTDIHPDFSTGFSQNYPGLYPTKPTMTVQFSHLLPVWLAQAFSTLGHHGLFRLNALFAILALGIFYGFCRHFMREPFAVIATLFLAFNPSEIWLARITLSEVLTQLFIWSAFFMMFNALKNNNKNMARCTAFLFAFSTLIKVDGFFLIPLLVIAHIVQRIFERSEEKSSSIWPAFYQAAFPLFSLTIVYYMLDTKPYFLAQAPNLKQVGILTVISLFFLLAMHEKILKSIRPWVTHKVTLIFIGVILCIVTFYLYFVRPVNALLRGFSDNTFSDFSLVNLAQYLSPLIIFSAMFGWFLSIRSIIIKRENLYLCPLIICFVGYAALFLWNPLATPHGFFAIRRAALITIPGFIFFAFYAGNWLFPKLSKKTSLTISILALISLAIFTIKADRLIFFFAEHKGTYTQLDQLSEKLPDNEIIIANGDYSWIMPLYLSFDKHVIVKDITSEKGRNIFSEWIDHQTSKKKYVYLLYEGDFQSSNLQYTKVFDTVLSDSFSGVTAFPIPETVVHMKKKIQFIKITGRL